MTQQALDMWKRCMEIFRDNLNEQQFATWFTPMTFKSYDAEARQLRVNVPSSFFYEYMEEHFRQLLHRTIYRVFGEGITLTYDVHVADEATMSVPSDESSAKKVAPAAAPANEARTMMQAATPVEEWDSQLNPKFSFRNFIEGESNRLPRNVGQSIAANPHQQTFNPLFIYGHSGVGKTHLLNAIGSSIQELHPSLRVLYLSAHLFQVQYTDAIRKGKFNDFMYFYQSVDVLLIDDIQEMAGKERTEYAFFHIFNHLCQLGKQIIIASDRPPVELKGMQDRLITRFSSGLIAELENPEEELRRNILDYKIKNEGLNFPPDVVDYISRNVSDSVREMEGAVHSLLAYSVVYNREVDLEFAQRIVKRNVRKESKMITLDDIVDCCSRYYNVRPEEIYGKSRKANIAMARHMCMYLAQSHVQMTASKIGMMMGNRDHATVLHSTKTITKQLDVDKNLRQNLKDLEQMLKGD